MLISGNKDSLLRFIKNTDSVADLGGGKGDRWVSVLSKFPNLNLIILSHFFHDRQ